jgi:multidrug resistance efflux pump
MANSDQNLAIRINDATDLIVSLRRHTLSKQELEHAEAELDIISAELARAIDTLVDNDHSQRLTSHDRNFLRFLRIAP